MYVSNKFLQLVQWIERKGWVLTHRKLRYYVNLLFGISAFLQKRIYE